MSITVSFFESIKKRTGISQIEMPVVINLEALISQLGSKFGEEFHEFLIGEDTCFFLVNGKAILGTGGLGTPLKDGDRVEVLPVIEAG